MFDYSEVMELVYEYRPEYMRTGVGIYYVPYIPLGGIKDIRPQLVDQTFFLDVFNYG